MYLIFWMVGNNLNEKHVERMQWEDKVTKLLKSEHLVFSKWKEGQIWEEAQLQWWISPNMKFVLWSVQFADFIAILVFKRQFETNTRQIESNLINVKGCDFSMLYKTTQ